MRLFLALPVEDDVSVGALERLQDDLRLGRMVDSDQFHVTLAFLGDVGDLEAEDLHDTLGALALPPVAFEIGGVGFFGSAKPRLVYAGVGPVAPLDRLHRKLAQAARRVGLAVPHRRFVPHVTLSRLKARPEDLSVVAAFAARHAGVRLPALSAREVVLYRSYLRSDGPVYEALAAYPLG